MDGKQVKDNPKYQSLVQALEETSNPKTLTHIEINGKIYYFDNSSVKGDKI